MSRIHEALKKAEGERLPALSAAEGSALDFFTEGGISLTPRVVQSLGREGMSSTGQCLSLEELRRRCVKPGWKLNPDYDVFSAKQSSAVCAEQFRTLRARLYRVREKSAIRSLLITSTLPGEGKTFVALNLALAISRQHERRALLVDADLRTSSLPARMGALSTPGLSDYLNGIVDEFSILQADPKVELFFVPAGRLWPNPSELLANGMLKPFLDRLSPVFDWIIVDAPPLLAVADAGIMAECCDGVIVVIRAGETALDLIKTALQELRGNKLLGVVVTDVDESKNNGGYSNCAGTDRE